MKYFLSIIILSSFVASKSVLSMSFDFSFSEPFSGAKVESYVVDLTAGNNELRHYKIPADCQQVINTDSFGVSVPVGIIQRNLWNKVVNDCRYVTFVHQTRGNGEKDFVSQYDFYNAKLKDLPFLSDCKPGDAPGVCKKVTPDKLSIPSIFPFMEIRVAKGSEKLDECRFKQGAFRGYLYKTETGIRCESKRRAAGLRLISLDYADLNNDGYQDVLLRIIPLGRGISRMPILLPLTRFSPGDKFAIPENLTINFIGHR